MNATPLTRLQAAFYGSLVDPDVSLVYCLKHPGQAVSMSFWNPFTQSRRTSWFCPVCGTQLKEA